MFAAAISSILLMGFFSLLYAGTPVLSMTGTTWLTFEVASGLTPDTNGELIVFSRVATNTQVTACASLSSTNPVEAKEPAAPPLDYDICGYNVLSGVFFSITDSGTTDISPHIDNDWIAFRRAAGAPTYWDVYGHNHVSGEEIRVHTGQYLSDPAVHDSYVVVGDTKADPDPLPNQVIIYHLNSHTLLTVPLKAKAVDIYSRTVVIQHETDTDSNILGYDLINQEFFTISARPGPERAPRIHGDLVVWEWYGNIYGYDLQTQARLTFTHSGSASTPAVSDSLVVWLDSERGGEGVNVYAYDLQTEEGGWVTATPASISHLSVGDDLIVWQEGEDEIYAAQKATNRHFLPLIKR